MDEFLTWIGCQVEVYWWVSRLWVLFLVVIEFNPVSSKWKLNSLASWRCRCNLRLAIFKLTSRTNIFSNSVNMSSDECHNTSLMTTSCNNLQAITWTNFTPFYITICLTYHCRSPIISKWRTRHSGDTAVLHAKFHNDCATEMNIVYELVLH